MQEDYGLILISHSTDKVFKDESGEEYNQIVPTLDKRGNKIVTRMSDIIGYSRGVENPETGETETRLFMRGTSRFQAGSRFADTPDSIVFTYDNLVGAISDAVEKLEERYGSSATTSELVNSYTETKNTKEVEELIQDFNEIVEELMTKDANYYGPRITGIVNSTMGHGKKVSEATPAQAELVDLAIEELKELVKANK